MKIIFQIDAENFSTKFWVVLKILQVIVQVQNFIQKTFSGYKQVAYEKKEEQ